MCFELIWKLIADNSSTIIALCALIFTVWQAFLTREHNKLSVTPLLTTVTNTSSVDKTFIIEITNNGTGPAIIKELKFYFDQVEKELDSIKSTLNTTFSKQEFVCSFGQLKGGYVMSSNEKCLIMKIQFLEPVLLEKIKIDELVNRVKIIVKYESIYKNKYTFDSSES